MTRPVLLAAALLLAVAASTAPATVAPAWGQAGVAARPDGFAELSDRLMPAVVNIATTQRVEGLSLDGRFPPGSPLERYHEQLGEEALREVNSLGSGFVISADGVVVTNNHVIDGADEIEVIFQDGERLPAELIGRDQATDLAALRVKANRTLPFVPWGDSEATRVGEWVIAIGNPFGLGGSVSAGIISARNRNIAAGRYDDFLQTDAAINRGNSGGPLFNLAGEVIGVNTAIVSPTGGSVGVGFATPSSLARPIVDQLVRFGEARRGWLGVRMGQLTPELAARAGLPRPRGALIAAVTDGGPAAKGGLRPGDIVVKFGGRDVAESRNLSRMVADSAAGAAIVVEFLRGQRRMTTTVTVAQLQERRVVASEQAPRRPASRGEDGSSDLYIPDPDAAPLGVRGRVLGMILAELTPDVRAEYGLADGLTGLLVVGVDVDSNAEGRVEVGDIVREIGFTPIETVDEARDVALDAAKARRTLVLEIDRQGQRIYRAVRSRR